jgi:hypothetical protein
VAWTIAVARRGAAAELGQDLPAFEGGDGAFADGPDLGVVAVDGLLAAGQSGPVAVPLERCADSATGSLVRLVGGRHDVRAGQGIYQVVGASGG